MRCRSGDKNWVVYVWTTHAGMGSMMINSTSWHERFRPFYEEAFRGNI
jgi:hypothetical protein